MLHLLFLHVLQSLIISYSYGSSILLFTLCIMWMFRAVIGWLLLHLSRKSLLCLEGVTMLWGGSFILPGPVSDTVLDITQNMLGVSWLVLPVLCWLLSPLPRLFIQFLHQIYQCPCNLGVFVSLLHQLQAPPKLNMVWFWTSLHLFSPLPPSLNPYIVVYIWGARKGNILQLFL